VGESKFHRRFDYDRRLLPNAFLGELDEMSDLEEAKQRSGHSVGCPGWGLLYYSDFCALSPDGDNHLVETGSNFGASTIVITQALVDSGYDGHVHTVEIAPDNVAHAKEHVAQSGVANRVTLHIGGSKEVLRTIVADLPCARVAFLDGSHLFDDVVAEFEVVHPCLAPNGIVEFDNTYRIALDGEDQRVHGALSAIVARWGGGLVNFPTVSWFTPGMALWQQQPFDNRWEGHTEELRRSFPGLNTRMPT